NALRLGYSPVEGRSGPHGSAGHPRTRDGWNCGSARTRRRARFALEAGLDRRSSDLGLTVLWPLLSMHDPRRAGYVPQPALRLQATDRRTAVLDRRAGGVHLRSRPLAAASPRSLRSGELGV